MAFACYLNVAELGNSTGLYNVSIMYDKGLSVEQNFATAEEYLFKAAADENQRLLVE